MNKIIISAFACDPENGSEPYVGWNWVKMLSESFDVHVITREYNREMIEKDPLSHRVKFHYYDIPFAKDKSHYWRFIKPYYVLWQFLSYLKVKNIHSKENFKLAHHITYNNLDVPGFLWLLKNAKFVWGPVGGGQLPPTELKKVYGKHWWKQTFRKRLKQFARFNPIVRTALSRSSCVLFANNETKARLNYHGRHIIMLETAIVPSTEDTIIKKSEINAPPSIVWIGRVEERKALILALQSLEGLNENHDYVFNVVGEGPLLEDMQSYVLNSKIKDKVVFHGNVKHCDVKGFLSNAKLFLFTSVQDTSGNVVLEAMNEGVPIIALNHQGVKTIVTPKCGALIDIGNYKQTTAGFSAAIEAFLSDNELSDMAGRQASEEIYKNHTWEAKRIKIEKLYSEILSCHD